jgi:hypothetical protein
MLQLNNSTPFKAALMLLPDRDGSDTVYTVVKGTFTVAPQLRLADDQVAVAPVDKHFGDPALTSVRVPSDVCLGKPGTDVLISGSAWAPGGRAAWTADVHVSAGPLARSLRVFGDRVWDSRPSGASVAWVAPFLQMPLTWERAYGGRDETDKGPVADMRNPVGMGFRRSDSLRPLAGLPLPNVEDPAALMSSWKDAPHPAGCAAVAAHWQPRSVHAGTYDEAWQKSRAPHLPADFDPRFFQLAPAGLTAYPHLRGGEQVDLRGVTPDGVLQFALPALELAVTYRFDSGAHERPAVLDTVIVEPDVPRVVLVWRATLSCDKRALKVRQVDVGVRGTP